MKKKRQVNCKKDSLSLFREQYRLLNDDTIKKANNENPKLLIQLIEDRMISDTTRADILEALAVGARSEYLEFIKNKLNDESPHIRSAAINALFEFFSKDSSKHSDLLVFLKDKKTNENDKRVIESYKFFFDNIVGI